MPTPIVPCLWFDDTAEPAATLYTQTLGGTIHAVTRVQVDTPQGKPKGSVLTVEFEAGGQTFTALNGGPMFKVGPNISFFVFVESPDEATRVWKALEPGGSAMMPLDAYAWCDVFPNSKVEQLEKYTNGATGVMHGRFSLSGALFAAMDSHVSHESTFTEGLSLQVRCADQQEIDHFWSKLTAGGVESQCGWCKDRFGVSWQIIPANLGRLLESPSAFQAMFAMKKLDIAALERA
jgi:predicted 3-demethylubiquinone-9 3-methyltransferase (glyoxalase superfamily)